MSPDRTVYSSQSGRSCPACGQPIKRCRCPQRPAARELSTGDRVRVGRSSKGRKGKPVTTIKGLPLDDAALQDLARDLKRLCGSGGSLREGTIEIQGEHRDTLVKALRERGFEVKKSGS